MGQTCDSRHIQLLRWLVGKARKLNNKGDGGQEQLIAQEVTWQTSSPGSQEPPQHSL